jgi:hypothetical protein
MGFQHPKSQSWMDQCPHHDLNFFGGSACACNRSINRSSKINIKDWDSFKKGLYNSFSMVLASRIMTIFVQGQSEQVINYYIHFVDTINNIEASTRCTHKVKPLLNGEMFSAQGSLPESKTSPLLSLP